MIDFLIFGGKLNIRYAFAVCLIYEIYKSLLLSQLSK